MRPSRPELADLYEAQRLTTRAIADRFGVSHMSVKRWLKAYGIAARLSGTGLRTRGSAPPTKKRLERLVLGQHLSYAAIARRYGVDKSAVSYWIKQLGIEVPAAAPTGQRGYASERVDTIEMRRLYKGGVGARAIGLRFAVSSETIRRLLRRCGVKVRRGGFKNGARHTCKDGTEVRSTYEQTVGDWLTARGIPFDYEPRLDFDRRYRADFRANGWYIEVWGVGGSEAYELRRGRKLAHYRAHKAPLIQLEARHFTAAGNVLDRVLAPVFSPAPTGPRPRSLVGSG